MNLQNSWQIFQNFPEKIPNSTAVITAIKIASFYLKYYPENDDSIFPKANQYLDLAEQRIKNSNNEADKLAYIYGIRSEFAMRGNNLEQAKKYLDLGLDILNKGKSKNYETYREFYSTFSSLYEKEGDYKQALAYEKKAEEMDPKIFDKQQIFNAQKLEILFESQKKDEQLKLLQETADLRKYQNYLWLGIAVVSLFGLGFMVRAYHFKLKYSMEREKKILNEKEEAELNSEIRLQLEMDTKQIAKLLHVEDKSVRMFKYRLKQKFGMKKEDDLDVFLQEIR